MGTKSIRICLGRAVLIHSKDSGLTMRHLTLEDRQLPDRPRHKQRVSLLVELRSWRGRRVSASGSKIRILYFLRIIPIVVSITVYFVE